MPERKGSENDGDMSKTKQNKTKKTPQEPIDQIRDNLSIKKKKFAVDYNTLEKIGSLRLC